jgi:NAD-dependent deacetylase
MDIPDQLIATLRAARHVMVLTGAGVSAESGLATFRDPLTGLWERFNPQELATPEAFRRDPSLVWGWYEWRRMKVLRAQPNPAHRAIHALEDKVPRLTLVTQNVDDLHERAGSTQVHHLHGTLAGPYCSACREPHAFGFGVPEEPEEGRRVDPPLCASCGACVRPGVVWFGEGLPQDEWAVAERAAEDCDVFFCVGTSSVVYPAASLIELAVEAGATTIQVNPGGSAWDRRVSYDFRAAAGAVLPNLIAIV